MIILRWNEPTDGYNSMMIKFRKTSYTTGLRTCESFMVDGRGELSKLIEL